MPSRLSILVLLFAVAAASSPLRHAAHLHGSDEGHGPGHVHGHGHHHHHHGKHDDAGQSWEHDHDCSHDFVCCIPDIARLATRRASMDVAPRTPVPSALSTLAGSDERALRFAKPPPRARSRPSPIHQLRTVILLV